MIAQVHESTIFDNEVWESSKIRQYHNYQLDTLSSRTATMDECDFVHWTLRSTAVLLLRTYVLAKPQ